VIVDAYVLKFSKKQYQALELLIQGKAVTIDKLIRVVYGDAICGSEATNLGKLIRDIKEKLVPVGITAVKLEGCAYKLEPIPDISEE
jgi:DNA-binding response OmpR family regulator